MEIYLGNELGNLCEQDCQMVKEIMDGKTYYQFKVSWSNYAGNCQLIAETDYDCTEDEAKGMFLHAYFSNSAEIARWHKILEQFCKNKQEHPDGVVVFGNKYDFSVYFQDAEFLSQQNIPSLIVGKTTQGYSFASIQRHKFAEVIETLIANGKEAYMAETEGKSL